MTPKQSEAAYIDNEMTTWDSVCLNSWTLPVGILVVMILFAMLGITEVPTLEQRYFQLDPLTYFLLALFILTMFIAIILRAIILPRRIAKLRAEYYRKMNQI